MTVLNFDASKVAPAQALEPLPTDWYAGQIVESEMRPTRDNKGQYLNLGFQVMQGPYAGRRVYARLNVQNNNAQAVDIAHKELSAICHAVGVIQCADSQQLHGKPIEFRVMVNPPSDGYDASNEIKGYRAYGSGKSPAGNGAGAAMAAQAFPAQQPAAFAPPMAAAAPAFAPQPAPAFGGGQFGQPGPAVAPAAAPAMPGAGAPPWGAPPAAAQPAFPQQPQPAAFPQQPMAAAPGGFPPPAAAPAAGAPPWAR